MANEARITNSLQIVAGYTDYQARPTAFTATVTGRKGPTPGAISVAATGTVVSFAELAQPALCRIQNLDTVNYITYGIWDPETSRFYPLGELLPGESYILRLSRFLHEEYGTGTGTVGGPSTNSLKMYANASTAVVLVEAFEV